MNDSVASETNNMISVTSDKNQFSDSRLTAAAIFAFLPFFGVFGVHNFILKQYGKGIAHIIIVVLCYIPYIIASALCDYYSNCYRMVMITMFLQYLAVASYIWAIVEGVQILQSKKRTTIPLQETSSLNNVQTPKPAINAGNTDYFVADRPSPETIMKIKQEKKQNREMWSIISTTATVVPIMLWIHCLVASKNGSGAIWFIMIIYYWSLGIPLAVISIAFGIIGLKTNLRWLSIISLSLKVIMIIIIPPLLFTH